MNELDTSSDTLCAGSNQRLLSTSGNFCDVYGFYDDFKDIKDVPIEIVAAGTRNENGRVHILIVNQGLYFWASLYHSLINPNQIRHLGILVSGNPYDSGQDFGINQEDQFTHFKTEGLSVCFQFFCANVCCY